jgi:hypothetical protein
MTVDSSVIESLIPR